MSEGVLLDHTPLSSRSRRPRLKAYLARGLAVTYNSEHGQRHLPASLARVCCPRCLHLPCNLFPFFRCISALFLGNQLATCGTDAAGWELYACDAAEVEAISIQSYVTHPHSFKRWGLFAVLFSYTVENRRGGRGWNTPSFSCGMATADRRSTHLRFPVYSAIFSRTVRFPSQKRNIFAL